MEAVSPGHCPSQGRWVPCEPLTPGNFPDRELTGGPQRSGCVGRWAPLKDDIRRWAQFNPVGVTVGLTVILVCHSGSPVPVCDQDGQVLPAPPRTGFFVTFLPPLKTAVAPGLLQPSSSALNTSTSQGPNTTGRPAEGAPKGCTRRWLWGPREGTLSPGPFP